MEKQREPIQEHLRFFAFEREEQRAFLEKEFKPSESGRAVAGSKIQDYLLAYLDMAMVHFERMLPFMDAGELKKLVAEMWALLGVMLTLKWESLSGEILWQVLDENRAVTSQDDGL